MKIAVITTSNAMARIWNHAKEVSSHDLFLIPLNQFRSRFVIPRIGGWRKLMEISPDCIWIDQHNIEVLYSKLYQVYGHDDVPLIGYLRGDIWTEVADVIDYLMSKREKNGEYEYPSLLKSLAERKDFEGTILESLYSASLPLIAAYKFYFSFLRNVSMNQYDLLVCISTWLEKRAHDEMPHMPTDVWYRGMNYTPFLNVTEPWKLAHPCVGILQSHSIWRKTSALLEFTSVIERLPHIHFYISEGVARWSEFLPQVKEVLGRFKNVHFLKVTPEQVPLFLSSIDCYVLVSGLDAFPTTVREAQLARAPVVASNVGGTPEALADSPWNACIENGDTEKWVETLREYVKGKGQNEEGQNYVISTFKWEAVIKEFEEICLREIERKSK